MKTGRGKGRGRTHRAAPRARRPSPHPGPFSDERAYPDLEAKAFGGIDGTSFQDLCCELIDEERRRLHPGARLDRGAGQGVGDGGEDIGLRIDDQTGTKASCVLTEPGPIRMCFSCKSGPKKNWLQKLLKNDLRADGRPVKCLRSGGIYKILSNQELGGKKKDGGGIKGEIVKALENLDLGKTWQDRIVVLDAGDLKGFLQRFGPILPDKLAKPLGLDTTSLRQLDRWPDWETEFRGTRGVGDTLSRFESDQTRHDALEELARVLGGAASDSTQRVFWIHGPPGFGKTRLVLEATRKIAHRVFYARNPETARGAIRQGAPRLHSNLVLVVDECPTDEVRSLHAQFAAKAAETGAALIVIGLPPARESATAWEGMVPFPLGKLDDAATGRMVADVWAGAPAGTRDRIVSLTQGIPGFTVLLAQNLGKEALGQDPPQTVWEAVQIALAGRRESGDNAREQWEKRALRRARAVFAVGLTETFAWDELTQKQQADFGAAFGAAEWQGIRQDAADCLKRGIVRLRTPLGHRYVSPEILFTEAAKVFLGPDHGLAESIRQHAPELLGKLYPRLERAGVGADLLERLAGDELARLRCEQASLPALARLPLSHLARWQPALAVAKIRCILETTSLEALRERREVRRPIMFALEQLCFRRVPFADLEAALSRLALAENEGYGNNATAIWTSLFAPQVAIAHCPLDERFRLLEERARSDSPEVRRLAVACLARHARNLGVMVSWAPEWLVEGPLVAPPPSAQVQAMATAWDLLIEATSDPDAETAAVARRGVADGARSSAHLLLVAPVSSRLSQRVAGWAQGDRLRLRAALDRLRAFDLANLDRSEQATLDLLAASLAPESFHERLVDLVGRNRFLDELPHDYERANRRALEEDQALARQGLAGSMPLLSELDWLSSKDALRAWHFLSAAGTVDGDRRLLEALQHRALEGAPGLLLPAYLHGVASAGQVEEVDRLLRGWRDEARWAVVTLQAISAIGPTDERIAWLVEDIAAHRLPGEALMTLAWGSWAKGASPGALVKLLEAMSNNQDRLAWVTAIQIAVQTWEWRTVDQGDLRPLLRSLLGRLASGPLEAMAAHFWTQAAKILLADGEAGCAIEAAGKLISSVSDLGTEGPAWSVIEEAMKRAPVDVWRVIAGLLEAPETAYRVAMELGRRALLRAVPPGVVGEWIGRSEQRASLMARACDVHGPTLDPVAREILMRFGPEGGPARDLSACASSTRHSISSLSGFWKAQMENASRWAEDDDSRVAVWARAVSRAAAERLAVEQAWDEIEDEENGRHAPPSHSPEPPPY
ncbi:MAG: hypothetical protein ACYDCL_01035 [Myxococcales bacterium]